MFKFEVIRINLDRSIHTFFLTYQLATGKLVSCNTTLSSNLNLSTTWIKYEMRYDKKNKNVSSQVYQIKYEYIL